MSTQSVKTRAWEQLQIERNIRPYRHTIIGFEAYTLAPENGSWVYIVNEITGFIINYNNVTSTDGNYKFNVDLGAIKNLNNLEFSVNWSYSTLTSVVPMSIILESTAPNLILYSTDVSGSSVALDGKVIITIKEYYG